MNAADGERGRRSWLGLLVPALLVFAALIALGTWQLQRKAWKEALIETLTARLAAPPVALLPPAAWQTLDAAAASAFRPDVSSPGFWVLAPARLADGSVVVVNRGFLPSAAAPNFADAQRTRNGTGATSTVAIVGVVRWPETTHWFTPRNDPAHNLWLVRDPVAIAAAKGWGPVAPFYVEQESPVPEGGLPQPGKLVVRLPNNHLQYAVTWYGLALVLVVVFAVYARSSLRGERASARPRNP